MWGSAAAGLRSAMFRRAFMPERLGQPDEIGLNHYLLVCVIKRNMNPVIKYNRTAPIVENDEKNGLNVGIFCGRMSARTADASRGKGDSPHEVFSDNSLRLLCCFLIIGL